MKQIKRKSMSKQYYLFFIQLQVYKLKIEEIEKIEEKMKKIKDEYSKSKQINESQQKILENFLINLEEKRLNFDIFMKDKGKQALNYVLIS